MVYYMWISVKSSSYRSSYMAYSFSMIMAQIEDGWDQLILHQIKDML